MAAQQGQWLQRGRVILRCMRALSALIEQVRKINTSLKELAFMLRVPAPRKKFRTAVHSCGRCYLPNLDNTAEVLEMAEGELS